MGTTNHIILRNIGKNSHYQAWARTKHGHSKFFWNISGNWIKFHKLFYFKITEKHFFYWEWRLKEITALFRCLELTYRYTNALKILRADLFLRKIRRRKVMVSFRRNFRAHCIFLFTYHWDGKKAMQFKSKLSCRVQVHVAMSKVIL